MFKRVFSLIQDELNHDAGDKSERNCNHECKISGTSRFFLVLKHLIDRHGGRSHFKLKVLLISSDSEEGIVKIVRVEG